MNNDVTLLPNLDFKVTQTNISEFERSKPIETYKKITQLQNQLKSLNEFVNQLQLEVEKLKDSFLKGE